MKIKNIKTGEKAEVEISCNSMLVTYENGKIEQYYFDSLKDLDECTNKVAIDFQFRTEQYTPYDRNYDYTLKEVVRR